MTESTTDTSPDSENAPDTADPATTDESVKTDEPVLSSDEKEALLDGMSSGEVSVHSRAGPTYASVRDFEVSPRSRIVTNSFPRLQSLNRQFAGRVGKQIEALLNADCSVTFNHLRTCTFSEFSEQGSGLSLLVEFAPKPLEGSALINLDAALIEVLVETFYGGDSDDLARPGADFFTPGEVNVATLFCRAVIGVTGEVWQPIAEFNPELLGPHLNSGVIDCIDGSDDVISAEYELAVRDKVQTLHVVWPVSTVASLLPVFEGQKRERNIAEDSRWERSIRTRVVDSVVTIASDVGKTELTLRDVAEWSPGDVVMINNPQKSTVFAQNVAILEGRFGVHDGRHAVETTEWLEAEI